MTDKLQKVLNEVERLQNELITEKKKGFGSDVDDACILELQNIKNYIKFVQEEPVSEDLGKAAMQYAKLKHKDATLQKIVSWDFKAGAKWKKEQMMAKAVDGEVGYWNQRCLSVLMSLPSEFEEDDKVKVIVIKED